MWGVNQIPVSVSFVSLGSSYGNTWLRISMGPMCTISVPRAHEGSNDPNGAPLAREMPVATILRQRPSDDTMSGRIASRRDTFSCTLARGFPGG